VHKGVECEALTTVTDAFIVVILLFIKQI